MPTIMIAAPFSAPTYASMRRAQFVDTEPQQSRLSLNVLPSPTTAMLFGSLPLLLPSPGKVLRLEEGEEEEEEEEEEGASGTRSLLPYDGIVGGWACL